MDINLLTVNVGNSRVSLGVFVGGELAQATRFNLGDAPGLAAGLADAWAKVDRPETAEVAGASVNPIAQEAIEHAVVRATGKPVQWVGRDLDLPIEVKTDVPADTGVDRVLSVAAAYEQMEKACVVVDAGTALTLNLCNDSGHFVGGAIAPGARLMLDALHNHTAKLPDVPLARPAGLIGTSTEQAMLVGVVSGIRGMVKEIVEGYAEHLGSWPDMICTGGDAQLLFGDWELAHAIAPDLTLYGIALAYTEHHIKNES
ncbi:MAG TPA: type III pantothenate kinase [Tepidisphaeraceae bacterium]|jgi:type III pantothenate kinase